MLCILYVNTVGALLSLLGLVVERLRPVERSRRWIWCVTIVASLVVPGYYRYHHAHALDEVLPLDAGTLRHLAAFDDLIGAGWLLVTAALACHAVGQVLYLAIITRRSTAGGSHPVPALVDGEPVIVTASLGPATVGVVRPQVLLPRWVLGLPAAERRYIVQHEAEHRRARDATLLLVAALPAILFPWNIPLWWQLRRLHLAVEMDCDRRVLARLGDARAYGRLLLAVASTASPAPRLQPGLLGEAGMLERRLTQLLAPPVLPPPRRAILLAVAVLVAAVVLLAPHPVLPDQHGSAIAHAPPSTAGR